MDTSTTFILWRHVGPILYKDGGPSFRTRDGRRAVVLEVNAEKHGDSTTGRWAWAPLYQGRVEGEWTEWDDDGHERGGREELDLVGVYAELN